MKREKTKRRRTTKKIDQKLITELKEILESDNYEPDKMTPNMVKILERYEQVFSIKSKAREQVRIHIRKHRS